MATAVKPTEQQPESPNALALYDKKELQAFTGAEARALLTPMLGGVAFEQVLSELYFAIQKNSAIAKCSPASQLQAVARCLTWGLTIGEKAHLVPFKGTLTAVMDYKGAIELIVNARGAKSIDAHWVYEDDRFEYRLGSNAMVDHIPKLSSREGKKIVAGYAVAVIGTHIPPKVVVMGVDEINKIRSKSQSWYAKKDRQGNVTGHYTLEEIPWYVAKTCVNQIKKQLPMTPALREVAAHIDAEETVVTEYVIEQDSRSRSAESGESPQPASTSSEPDADGALNEPGDGPRNGPPCPKCGAKMRDDTVTKTNVKAPGYRCVAMLKGDGPDAADIPCDGLYWPGQWPPKPPATDEQRAELGRLSKVAEKVGLKKVTIDAVNRKCADPDLKSHHADQHIKALSEKIAEKEKEIAAAGRLKSGDGNLDSHPDTVGKF